MSRLRPRPPSRPGRSPSDVCGSAAQATTTVATAHSPFTVGKQVRRLQHNTAVHDSQFSPEGRWLIAAANKAGLWDVGTREIVLRLQGHEGATTAATFDPTGRRILTGGADGTVRTFDCEICGNVDRLLALARTRLAQTRRELTPEERERYLR